MTKLKILTYSVRVWSTINGWDEVNANISYLKMKASEFRFEAGLDTPQIAEYFAKLDNVAAVEVLNEQGSGVLIYPDWK